MRNIMLQKLYVLHCWHLSYHSPLFVSLRPVPSYANMGSAFVLYVHNFNCMGMDSTFQYIARMVMIIDKYDNVVDDGAEDDNDMLV